MRYKRLRITHYRGVESSVIEFKADGLTVVQGPNEIGKTSLGEAIGILFEYPASSKHRVVKAIQPVHRDVGTEIELEAESGSYHFTYYKRFHKRPETTLTISTPRTENLTGREAHERAEQILNETLDIHLWRALAIQQGEAIEQPNLADQQSLSAALDKVAGGVPTDQAEEGLFEKVTQVYEQFYTPTGKDRAVLTEARRQQDEAESTVREFEERLRELDQDVEAAARLQKELTDLKEREATLEQQLKEHQESLNQIEQLESKVTEATLKLESAQSALQLAIREMTDRKELIQNVERVEQEHRKLSESSAEWISRMDRTEKRLADAETELQQAEQSKREADQRANVYRADFDYFNNKLFLEQIRERKQRIDQARKDAAHAESFLSRCQIDSTSLEKIEAAERAKLMAEARLENAAPTVKLIGLKDGQLVIDDQDTTIGSGEEKAFPVADQVKIVVPDHVEIQIAAGSSIDQLTQTVADSLDALNTACREAGVESPEAARQTIDEVKEAEKKIQERDRVERENLRDLTYDQLSDKLVRLEQIVPNYVDKRTGDFEMAGDLSEARSKRDSAEKHQVDCGQEWEKARQTVESARKAREQLKSEYDSARVDLQSLAKDLKSATERLQKARRAHSDDDLQKKWEQAQAAVESEKQKVKSAEEALKALNPERVKAMAETTENSLATSQQRRRQAHDELNSVQARLEVLGEEGLYEKLQSAKTQRERIESENRSLFRRAAAAKTLYDTMSQERDEARRAYVAPLKERIERLGRLVFDESFQVEVDEDLQIASRSLNGISVPFDSLSGGTREQLSLIFRLACSMIVADEGGMPLIMDDALGYTDPTRLHSMGAVLARAARECQIVVFTCVPDRYANVGEAAIVSL